MAMVGGCMGMGNAGGVMVNKCHREGFVAEREADPAAIVGPWHSLETRSAPGTSLSKIRQWCRMHKWCPQSTPLTDFRKRDKSVPVHFHKVGWRRVGIMAKLASWSLVRDGQCTSEMAGRQLYSSKKVHNSWTKKTKSQTDRHSRTKKYKCPTYLIGLSLVWM